MSLLFFAFRNADCNHSVAHGWRPKKRKPLPCHLFSEAAPLPPRFLTPCILGNVYLWTWWRSGLPFYCNIVVYIDIENGWRRSFLGEASGGALHSSTFCDCVRLIIPFHNLSLVFFLNRISAEKRRSGYGDVIFGCEHRNSMIGRSFVDAVSRFSLQNHLQF